MATTPRQMKHRSIDNDSLHTEIMRQQTQIGELEIHTRAQAKLADAEAERNDLEQRQLDMRAEIAKTEANIAALQDLLIAQKATEADYSINLNAVQELIHALRQSGVTLP